MNIQHQSSSPARSRRRRAIGLSTLLLVLLSMGCAQDEEPVVFESDLVVEVPPAGSPGAQDLLRQLLAKGSLPGTMEPIERRQVEELIRPLIAPIPASFAGSHWAVKYLDMPGVDFVSAELMESEDAERLLWIQILPMAGKPLSGFEPGDLKPVGPYRARGQAGHHLFVRVGDYDVRIAADHEAARDDDLLRGILLGSRLDLIADL